MSMVLWIAVGLFPVSEVTLAILKRANPRTTQVEDRGSLGLLWAVILLSVGMAIALMWVPAARLHISATLHQTLTLALLVAGLAIRWWSILTLGQLFTVDVAIHRDHTLVETGLYKYIRHPSYAGLLMAFLGLGVAYANWLSILALVVPITLAIVNRIAKEEVALRGALGEPYAAYCARTKRLLPFLY